MSTVRRLLAISLLVATAATLAPLGAPPAAAGPGQTFGARPLDDVLHWAGQKRRCGLTTNKLAAMVIAVTAPETGAPQTAAPSPMTLSRWDDQNGLHSFGTRSGQPRAFWHPGIGMWQFDSAGLGAPFTASQRIDTYVVAARAAEAMAARWCTKRTLAYAWAPWHACGNGSCKSVFDRIYRRATDRLVRLQPDGQIGRWGGMTRRSCRGPGKPGTFTCWRVAPGRAQGHTAFTAPSFGPAPITAPFYVYAANGREYRHWLKRDTGYNRTIWASRPLGSNARSSLTWRRGEQLEVLPASGGGTVGFPDVPANAWYRPAVDWAVGQGLVDVADGPFRPTRVLTRSQAVWWLWLLQGRPAPGANPTLSDVPGDAWYRDAARWAVANGVVVTFDGAFRPNARVGRGQLASMMWKVAGSPAPAGPAPFSDVVPGDWYADAVAWVAASGYASGFRDLTFAPRTAANRAQAISWLHAAHG